MAIQLVRKAMIMKEQQPNELLSLTNDYVFRRIFGEKNKDSLADFLSAILNMPIDELADLAVDDPNLHREHKNDKSSKLDVRVHTKSGQIINIEIQVNPEHSFGERIAYYNARIYSGQLKKGEIYSKLHRTVSVVITDFVFIQKNEDCLNRFMWYNIDNGTLLTDAQEINILELPKLPENDDGTKLWQWLKILKLRDEDEMEDIAKDNEAIKNVIVTLREMSADEAEQRLAEARERDERDRISSYVSGVLDGEEKAKHEHARRMKAKGISVNDIADITGLTLEEIEKL